MEEAKSQKQVAPAWSDFLLASAGIYSKLEQGVKGCGTSEGWFGRKKHDRKKDELLRYIHHARNTDEHGLSGTTLRRASFKGVNIQSVGVRLGIDGEPIFDAQGGKDATVEITQATVLKAVKDERYGDTFMPPTQHLGQPVPGGPLPDAVTVAKLGLAYLERLVSEASQLPQHR
jgi:hypothetical protein